VIQLEVKGKQLLDVSLDPLSSNVVRVRSLDIIKGAAILGVVMAHLVFVQTSGNSVPSKHPLGEFFYSALPLFIIITGYFYKARRGLFFHIKNRIVPLLLIFAILTVLLNFLMYCYLGLMGYDFSDNDFWGNIGKMLVGKGAFQDLYGDYFEGEMILGAYEVTHAYYFLQMLIVGSLIFYTIADIALRNWKRTLVAAIILTGITAVYMEFVHIQLPFMAQLGPLAAAFILIGAFLGKHHVAEYLENGYRERRYWKIFAIVLAASILCVFFIPTNMSLIYSEFGDYGGWSAFTFVITTFFCGMSLLFMAALFSKIPYASDVLAYLGVTCASVFLFHMFVAKFLASFYVTLNTECWIPITDIINTVALATATVVIIVIFDQAARKAGEYLGIK